MDDQLERLRRAPSILEVLLRAGDLGDAAARSIDPSSDRAALIEAIGDESDAPTAIAAIHALGHLPGPGSDERLVGLLRTGSDWRAPHAAWALTTRPSSGDAIHLLMDLLGAGRLGGMLAQRTLCAWGVERPNAILASLLGRLRDESSPEVRARLVETMGMLPGTGPALVSISGDASEPPVVRIAALAALGDHPEIRAKVLETLAADDGPLSAAASLALLDRQLASDTRNGPDGAGLRIGQVHLGGHLDTTLTHAGRGQTGGIATLLVQLGDALARDPRAGAVTTIGQGSLEEGVASVDLARSKHAVMAAPLGPHEGSSFTDPWPARIAAERGLRRILALRPVDVLHLRMADVGSLAAANIARERQVPTVFTLAPDPHALIAELERTGGLDRASFGPADALEGLWFRASLVRRLADTARHVALLPRPGLRERLRDLVGIDVAADLGRYHVVPEGIDPEPVLAAGVAARRATHMGVSGPLAELDEAIAALGPERQGLPIVVSAGRLVEVKGMARIAEAFALDPELRGRANLVIVGGDLSDPSPAERAEIGRIEAVLMARPELAEALVMLGHRPHDDALRMLAIARHGLRPSIAPGGAYVCGSRKEEFGLAIVEALATGLPVVAPEVGGPASYVEAGRTGYLVDTLDVHELGRGILGALDLVGMPGRVDRAERMVEQHYTIGSMAETLMPIYLAARLERAMAAA